MPRPIPTPSRPEALRELSRADVELEALRRERVEAARGQGATWDRIGGSLGMSRRSAWEYYTRETRQVLGKSAAGCSLDEDEAMRAASAYCRIRPKTPTTVGGLGRFVTP